jgi:phenylpropionate dioxygenase-like ring-hydroxylating dioxygenase large terminal subunit
LEIKKMTNASVSYYKHWSIISRIKDLDPNKINTFNFLGERIVVWKPSFSAKYSVFIDECPHCKGPLRTGYIDNQTETLVCSYQGCRFDTQGVCTHNPHAENPDFIANNCYKNSLFEGMTVLKTCEENAFLMGFSPAGLRITHHIERLD